MSNSDGIQGFSIHETPVAVIDFETTGLKPGLDRVLEDSVCRLEPEESPYFIFDSLVNPQRPMSATEIHLLNLEKSISVCPELVGRPKNERKSE